jgi:hypothetical protein
MLNFSVKYLALLLFPGLTGYAKCSLECIGGVPHPVPLKYLTKKRKAHTTRAMQFFFLSFLFYFYMEVEATNYLQVTKQVFPF